MRRRVFGIKTEQFSLLPLHYDLETVFTVATFSFACLWSFSASSLPPLFLSPLLLPLLLPFFTPLEATGCWVLSLSLFLEQSLRWLKRSLFQRCPGRTLSAQGPFTGNNESNTLCSFPKTQQEKREGIRHVRANDTR